VKTLADFLLTAALAALSAHYCFKLYKRL